MFSIGKFRIMHESEVRKFEKLHKIFRCYSEDQLDEIISGKIHLRRSPGPRKRELKVVYKAGGANE